MTENNPFFARFAEIADKQNRIAPELYEQYSVKRGLRNNDGTGVLVGLTEIGQVHGYIIDEGEKTPVPGVLSYRGMDIRDIIDAFQHEGRFGFEETAFLLLFGNLPARQELDDFTKQLGLLRTLPEHFTEDVILKVPSENLMNKLAGAVLSLYSFDPSPDSLEISNLLRQSVQLISRFPSIAAYAFQAKNHYLNGASLFIHAPDKDKGTAENLLMLIREDQSYSQLEAEVLDLCLVLHAEHGGGNNSAFTAHVVSSTGTDTYSAISAAIGSLKGPLHGGASEKARIMMLDIMDKVSDWSDEEMVSEHIAKLLRKEAFDRSGLVYGMGHAVYTKSDPRAELLKKKVSELANSIGLGDEFKLYELVERIAPKVFSEVTGKNKSMGANVDFYSGFAYNCLGIPQDLFTSLFAVSRIVGWCAHRIEEIVSGGRIMRPAYRSITKRRPYTPLAKRG